MYYQLLSGQRNSFEQLLLSSPIVILFSFSFQDDTYKMPVKQQDVDIGSQDTIQKYFNS